MKILIALCALTLAAHAATTDRVFLDALSMKEVGRGWDGKPGPCGELSRWQITWDVWVQEMPGVPFESAYDEATARACALKHLARLRALIIGAGQRPTPERLATCWHFGASHRRRASEWGREVQNLCESVKP